MSTWTPLFKDIVTSSVWVESDQVLRVWVLMLAMKDQQGFVAGTIPGFANICKMSTEDFENATKILEAPDRYSKPDNHEGRRIKKIEGGWLVLNHYKYRDLMKKSCHQAYKAMKQREYRARGGKPLPGEVAHEQASKENGPDYADTHLGGDRFVG